MNIQIVDVPGWTPPYDHALSAGLARAGAEVELVTTYFPFGPVPSGAGYRTTEAFYRRSSRLYAGRANGYLEALPGGLTDLSRRAVKAVEHVPDMLRFRQRARAADVVHFQWLTFDRLDMHLLPRTRPRVLTAHNILPRAHRPRDVTVTRRLFERMDAIVTHSDDGARRLREELGVASERVHVIPHGAFDYLTRLPDERPLPAEFAAVHGPVILFFGLLRPYKGLDVLLDAFASVEGAELWIVGMPHLDITPLLEQAHRAAGHVRFLPRFLAEPEIPAFFRRADVVVLPYREIDQSGVLYTALAFGKPLVLSTVGGFPEVAERDGAAQLVPPDDADRLGAALQELVDDEDARNALGGAARRAAAERYSWDAVAARTLGLYRELLEGSA